ncbi:MAG: type II toxin-antitoxin system VapC family toxin [Acidimicrobiales bacterium]|nr:type II toxin-antitoxin system VapC family toxin [Acidimicrobiales bacterium]
MPYYADTSALVKLVVAERESAALLRWLARDGRQLVSSDLARTELMRTVRRAVPDRAVLAREVLESVTLLQLPTEVFEIAGRLEPATMRSLDALHLAAALHLGDDLEGLLTYDDRLATAAEAVGIPVVAPGAR